MSEEKDAPPEVREKIVKALKEGRVKWSDHGQEYWDRVGVIKGGNDADHSIIKADVKFWGKWEKENNGGQKFGNLGGMEICWQTVSAGFGSLVLFIDFDGKLKAQTESMSKEFCKSVLMKVIEDMEIDDGD